jgi:hypothetical protein
MGTNYYRIPTEEKIETRKERLQSRIRKTSVDVNSIEQGFRYIGTDSDLPYGDKINPWDEFVEGTRVHLGKRSSGWRFCWNFHDNRYYQDRASLLAFVRSGRVVDEYGESWDTERFIEMALEWGEPDGLTADAEYFDKNPHRWMPNPLAKKYYFSDYYDRDVDGLRVSSSTEFS